MVILTSSSRKANWCGEGSRSRTTRGSPIGSSVYLIFTFIDRLSFAPIPSTDDSDQVGTQSEPDCQYPGANLAEAKIATFLCAVRRIFSDHPLGIGEGVLSQIKRDSVFRQVRQCLVLIPLETRFQHTKVYHSYGNLAILTYGYSNPHASPRDWGQSAKLLSLWLTLRVRRFACSDIAIRPQTRCIVRPYKRRGQHRSFLTKWRRADILDFHTVFAPCANFAHPTNERNHPRTRRSDRGP